MANIRGLNDVRGDNNNNNGQGQFTGADNEIPDFLNAFMKAQQDGASGNPREEKFWSTMSWLFAPGMTKRSFIFVISAVQVVVFLLTVILTPIEGKTLSTSAFLGPNPTVYEAFNKQPMKIKCSFEVWRVLTPVFLHVGFGHIVQNLITQIIFGNILELMVGFKQTAAIYFISGIGGNLFSSYIQADSSIGASTADFGLLFGIMSMIMVNWNAFKGQQLEQMRCILMFVVIIMIVFNLMATGANSDAYGHIGGGICGLLYGFGFLPRIRDGCAQTLRKVGIAGTALFFILFTTLLYTKPSYVC